MTDPRSYTSFEILAVDNGFIVDREWFDGVDPNKDVKEQDLWSRRRYEKTIFTSWDDVVKYVTDNKVVPKPTK